MRMFAILVSQYPVVIGNLDARTTTIEVALMTLEVTQFVAMFLAAFYSAVALFYLMFAKLSSANTKVNQ